MNDEAAAKALASQRRILDQHRVRVSRLARFDAAVCRLDPNHMRSHYQGTVATMWLLRKNPGCDV